MKEASKEAQENLEQLQADQATKASISVREQNVTDVQFWTAGSSGRTKIKER
jgi:hypothetical protein